MVKNNDSGFKVKNIILAIAIAIVFAFFVGYFIQLVYPSPDYSDFCKNNLNILDSQSEAQCIANNGTWQTTPFGKTINQGYDCYETSRDAGNGTLYLNCNLKDFSSEGYCDYYSDCSNLYNNANEKYSQNYFLISLIIGIIVFVVAVLLQLVSVSAGLMIGSVITMFVGTVRYWAYSSDVIRVLTLGVVLAILVWLGYKKLSK